MSTLGPVDRISWKVSAPLLVGIVVLQVFTWTSFPITVPFKLLLHISTAWFQVMLVVWSVWKD